MNNAATPGASAVQQLYTRRARSYVTYVQAFGHRQGLSAVLARTGVLGPGARILDAGCGTGLSILALAGALHRRGLRPECVHGFDFTPAMLRRCQATLEHHRDQLHSTGIRDVELRQADILRLADQLPATWRGYDVISCASMLEHIPRPQLPAALAALRSLLAPQGHLLIVITRTWFYPTRWIWHCHGYTRRSIRRALHTAGFTTCTFHHYPPQYGWLNIGNHVLTATVKEKAAGGPAWPICSPRS